MSAPSHRASLPRPRAVAAGPAIALVTLLAALITTHAAGVPLRDPGHVSFARLGVTLAVVAALAVLDIVVRAGRGAGTLRPSGARLARVRRERWPARRLAAVAITLVSFYVTYMAYRNLKSVVPLLRPGQLFDHRLAVFDRSLFGGHDPASVLHGALGTGIATPFLAAVYMLFFSFIPFVLGLALVVAPPRAGLFVATALAINWALGAGSYFLLPTLGPFHVDPAAFASLPASSVSHMQHTLVEQRAAFLHDPGAPGAAQSIGAFASLHVAIYATAALATQALGLRRPWKVAAWSLLALTTLSTMYFGWHFVLDDVAGVAIAASALFLARWATGFNPRAARAPRRLPAPTPEPA